MQDDPDARAVADLLVRTAAGGHGAVRQ